MRRHVLRTLIAAALPLSLLAGCANAPLDAQAKADIRRVAIARDIPLVERPTVFGDKAGAAFLMGGMIGTAIDQKASSLPDQLVLTMAAQRVDLRELVRSKLAAQLAARGFVVVADEAQADAVVRVNIAAYGLTGDILFGDGKRMPLLSVDARMVRRGSDTSVWRSVVSSNVEADINKQLDARPLEEFFKDGELLRREYDKIAGLVAVRLTQKL